jgi:hypothetical protein
MIAPSALCEFFKRGEVARDVRLLAAQGGFAPRAHDQLSILVLLLEDPDPEIRKTADDTLNRLPAEALSKFLARPDVSVTLRDFFAGRGILPAGTSGEEGEAPLIDVDVPEPGEEDLLAEDDDKTSVSQKIAKMSFTQRLKAASKGTREMRAILVRDTNKMIAAAVMSSPKLSEQEVEAIARMASVSEDVLRMIAHNRAWMKSYKIVVGLAKNPKTPVAVSMNLLQRINAKDLNQMAIDRNIPEPLRLAARKKSAENRT